MNGRRGLVLKISGGEMVAKSHFNYSYSATSIMNGQRQYGTCDMFSDLLFLQAYLCLLFVVFFWTWVRSTFNDEIGNRDPGAELLGIVFQK